MCGGNAREETPESLVIAYPARSGAEPYIALVVGGHDELGRLEAQKELAGLPSGSVPCAVVWPPAAAGQSVLLGSSTILDEQCFLRSYIVFYDATVFSTVLQ